MTRVTLVGQEAGLAHESVANFDNTFLLARSRLVRRLGRASSEPLEVACRALLTAAGCPQQQRCTPLIIASCRGAEPGKSPGESRSWLTN
ncbi:MAG: hypothetical protein ICV70_06920 [Jiangellaceae bacterium]|nr:hypothetical protein [Jiangellaceae bacterium]